MKRLLNKIARENIELFHTTSSQVLKKINESGFLLPASETGIVSNGLESINIPVYERTPSGNQNGIYLGSEYILNYYRDKAVDATHFNKELPNIPVDLKVNVQTDNLLPDLDDMIVLLNNPEDEEELFSLFEEGTSDWRTSLDLIEQVVHEGPISIEKITGVRFISENILSNDYNNDQIINETIQFNTWLSFEQAINQLEELENSIKNKELQYTSFSRLKRIKLAFI